MKPAVFPPPMHGVRALIRVSLSFKGPEPDAEDGKSSLQRAAVRLGEEGKNMMRQCGHLQIKEHKKNTPVLLNIFKQIRILRH